jgi:group I intron endonuclease
VNSGIYKITNVKNGKVYIGSAQNIHRRWKEHLRTLSNGTHHCKYLQNAFNKYGEKFFILSTKELIEDSSKHIEREQFWMDYYKSYNPKYGYNTRIKAESNLGVKYSEETKQRISLANKGKKRSEEFKQKRRLAKGKNSPMWGKKHSEETKKRMSLSAKGKIKSEEHRQNLSLAKKGKGNKWKGRKHTEETKKKMSLAKKGKPLSEETKRKISITIKKQFLSLSKPTPQLIKRVK